MTKIYLGEQHPLVLHFSCTVFPTEDKKGFYVAWNGLNDLEYQEIFDTRKDAEKYAELLQRTWGLVEVKD